VAGGLGALGGVFGEVAGFGEVVGDELVGDAAVPGEGERLEVELLTPHHGPAVGPVRMLGGVERGGPGSMVERVDELGQADAGRWRDDGVQVVRVDAVEADQGVEVDGAAALHFGGCAVGQPHRGYPADFAGGGREDRYEGDLAGAAEFGEGAFGGLFGAVPQFGGEGVEHDVVVVVVAVQAQRLAEGRVVGGVPGPGDGRLPVPARAGVVAAGVAGVIPATVVQTKPSRQGLPGQGRSDVGCSTLPRQALSAPRCVDEGRRDGEDSGCGGYREQAQLEAAADEHCSGRSVDRALSRPALRESAQCASAGEGRSEFPSGRALVGRHHRLSSQLMTTDPRVP
jgi:hypothetical protein